MCVWGVEGWNHFSLKDDPKEQFFGTTIQPSKIMMIY